MSDQMIITYVMVDIFCIIIALSIYYSINSDFGNEFEIKTLKHAMSSFCGFMVFGLVWLLMENEILPSITILAWISNMLSLWLLLAVAYFWYQFAISRLRYGILLSKKLNIVLSIPIILSGILALTTPFTKLVFTINKDGVYERGPLFIAFSLIGIFYELLVSIQAISSWINEKNEERKKLCLIIGVYILFPLSASILQLYLSGTPILAPATITGFFLVFITIQNSQINTDTLTGLNNRRSAFNYLDEQIHLTTDKKSTSVHMIDVNYFKEINDTWGHIEGDHALNIIGSALKKLSQKYNLFVARFGGDEFMIIRDCNCDKSDEDIVDLFRTILSDTCSNNNLKYDISVSIGYAKASRSDIHVNQLMEQADAMLYKEKEAFHKKHDAI